MINANDNQTITIREAAQEFGAHYKTLYYAFRRGAIDGDDTVNPILLYRESVKNYIKRRNFSNPLRLPFHNLDIDFDEVMRPIDFVLSPNNIREPLKYRPHARYFATSKGKVYNSSTDELAKQSLGERYFQIGLAGTTSIYVHILIALCFCANRLLKSEVHHIDGDRLNIFANNLIWLTHTEHVKAHHLMKTDRKAYRKFINDKLKENQWDAEYRCLVLEHDDRFDLIWLTKSAYHDYIFNERTLDEISTDESAGHKMIFKDNKINELLKKSKSRKE